MEYVDNLVVEQTLKSRSLITEVTTYVTSATTTTMNAQSSATIAFTGSTVGQILRLPDASTLQIGQEYEVYNLSTVPVTIQDNAGTVLDYLSQKRKIKLICIGTSPAAGVWIVDNNLYGANRQFNEQTAETSNTSTTTWSVKNTFTTENLPTGDYRLDWSFAWRVANANRNIQIQVLEGSNILSDDYYYATSTNNQPTEGGFDVLVGIGGVHTISLRFKVGNGGGTTVYCGPSRLEFFRVG